MTILSPPLVQLENLSRCFPGTPPVDALVDVSLTLNQGDYAVLVGPSGAGKSTLLNLIGLLDTPTAGKIFLDGRDTSALAESHRTALRGRSIGFVFQAFHLMNHRSVVENVELSMLYSGLPAAVRRERALEAISEVGLSHRSYALPSTLSGGERQRVAIARATVAEPRLLLCDEPTGNLDSSTAERILDLLDSLNAQGRTIVVITHDARVARRGRRRLEIVDGRLVPSGGNSIDTSSTGG